MAARVRTVADALQVFEEFSDDVNKRFRDQQVVNESVQKQIFEVRLEQKDIQKEVALVHQDTTEIKKLLESRRLGWQAWTAIIVSIFTGIAGIVVAIFKG